MSTKVIGLVASGLIAAAASAQAGPCAADLDFDGTVTGFDLATLLGQWGPCPSCAADLDGNGVVNGFDLAVLLGAWGADCSPTSTPLAGNPLGQYPFFEYVRAFNQGSEISIAIDPRFFSGAAGSTICDIYIVNKKTPAQWAGDPSLVDVTGGFQSEIFGGATIQANTFAISGSSGLNGTTGTQIGIGYDMVCDCNRNGQLDGGDFIDGLSDEAGLYVVRDTAAPGPYSVIELTYFVTGWTGAAGFSGENTFYPSNIAALGPRPLIIISHGAGHDYLWYDHIGNHMGSYGYVVMSHQNNVTGPITTSTTTLQHTDAFVANVTSPGAPTTAALAPLDNLVDTHHIMWIGHSRGGEGVAVAYDRVFDGDYIPTGWNLADISLVSSIAPIDFNWFKSGEPATTHGGAYHLWTGGADSDVHGCADNDFAQTFHLHDRAEEYRQSISLHGVGHGDFHNGGGFSFADGPCLIGPARTHAIMRGYLLPLVKRYIEDDIPSKDFLTRQWERFKPIGAPAEMPCAASGGVDVVVDLMYRDGPSRGNFMIDDFQSQPSLTTSSSLGSVTLTGLTDIIENVADDNNSSFTWSAADLMNSITLAAGFDDSRVMAFSWSGPASAQWSIVPGEQDLTDDAALSFRAAQISRHPHTVATLGDLTFDVVLVDGSGGSSRINIGAYGGGVEEPYQRGGPGGSLFDCGAGPPGWYAEFETIRIRLDDFLNNGSDLDLANIVAVRFEFAAPGSGTSPVGRLGLDEIEITKD